MSRVVYTSAIACFGGRGPHADATEKSPARLGATGDLSSKTKQEAHEVAVSFARDIDLTIVAPTGPIGPGDVGPTPTGRLLRSALTLRLAVVTRTSSNFADAALRDSLVWFARGGYVHDARIRRSILSCAA